jgi:hypothetical protein
VLLCCCVALLLCCCVAVLRARFNQVGARQELKKEIAKLRRHNAHLQTLANRSSIALEHEDDERADEAGHVRGGVGGGAIADKQLQHAHIGELQHAHIGGLPPAGPDFGASREDSGRMEWRSGGGDADDRAQERRCQPIQTLQRPREDDAATDQRAGRAPLERRPAECGREEEVHGQALSQALARKTRYVLSGNSLAVFESCSLSLRTHARAHTHTG